MTWPNQIAAANRRPAGQSNGSGNLSAIVAVDRAFPAAVAELGRSPEQPSPAPFSQVVNRIPILLFACLGVMFALMSCRSLPRQRDSALAHGDTIPWRYDQVLGLSMTLDDPNRVEYYSFGRKGALAVTFGERDGKCCGPLIGWRLYRGRLFLSDFEGHTLDEELYLVRYAHDEVVIRRSSGELARFKRQAN